jgi:NAD(P)H-dependent FMN reductase
MNTTPNNNTFTNTPPIQLAVIVGSTREGRRGHVVADWFAKAIADRTDVVVDLIDLADLELPTHFTFTPTPDLTDLRERLSAADAFVVVTPEYNHSYPASLKHAIDFGKDQWKRKVVGFVSYGGVSGGLRAVEHLRQVFAELHTHGVRDTVSFHGPWNGFGDDDQPSDAVGAQAAATVLVDELVWWASALRTARQAVDENGQW